MKLFFILEFMVVSALSSRIALADDCVLKVRELAESHLRLTPQKAQPLASKIADLLDELEVPFIASSSPSLLESNDITLKAHFVMLNWMERELHKALFADYSAVSIMARPLDISQEDLVLILRRIDVLRYRKDLSPVIRQRAESLIGPIRRRIQSTVRSLNSRKEGSHAAWEFNQSTPSELSPDAIILGAREGIDYLKILAVLSPVND